MRPFHRAAGKDLLGALIPFVLLAAASPAAAQGSASGLKPASPADIVAATSSCMAAVGPNGTDEGVLLAQGWAKATMTSKGKTVEAPLNVYGRKAGNVILMTAPDTKASGICTVMARIDRPETAPAVVNAMSTQLQTKPAKTEPGSVYWFAQQRIVQLATTGDRSKPSVRVSVMQIPEKSK